MAYSNVGTPVFYVDNYLYHKTIGTNITANTPSKLFTLFPTIAYATNTPTINLPVSTDQYDYTGNMKYYFAFLNHYLNTYSVTITPDTGASMSLTEVLNVNAGNTENGNTITPLSGSTIFTTTTTGISSIDLSGSYGYGAFSTGIQYTMPHSPDLKLNMEIEMDGVKTITTSGGGSFSNVQYSGNPLWMYSTSIKTNPFDVYTGTLDVTSTGARRNGRKSWSLKFSYINDTDLFSSNPRATSYTEHPNNSTYETSDLDGLTDEEPTSESYLAYNIETDDSFYAQVWNKTLGGALPFIFQPDSNHRDDFYICKFDQKSLKISQSAYKVYDISLKIVESW